VSVDGRDQGRVMGNNQALQVGAESLSGIIGGLLAAVMVKLSLVTLGVVAVVAAAVLVLVRGLAGPRRATPHARRASSPAGRGIRPRVTLARAVSSIL
jgi:hypothetical protein